MIDKIKILPGRVVVRPSEPPAEQKTGSGIIIPGTVAKKQNGGIVAVVGVPLPSEPHDIKVGDMLFYGERTGQVINVDDIEYRLLQAREAQYWVEKEELKSLNLI